MPRSSNPGSFTITSLSIKERLAPRGTRQQPQAPQDKGGGEEGTGSSSPLPYQLSINTAGLPLDDTSPQFCIGSEVCGTVFNNIMGTYTCTLYTCHVHVHGIALANEAPWCVDSPADIHLSDNVLLVLKQKKKNQF